MTTGEWSCLISFARAPPTCKEGKQTKNSNEKAVEYLCFKLLQYSEMTGNAWDVSKHVAVQLIKVLKFKCKQ